MKKLLALFLALALWAGFCTPAAATQYIYGPTIKGTVTIASSATTGTTDVGDAATGTYILFYNGCATSATASNAQSRARITISGDTVTATRGTAGTNTITCAFSLIDAHANLVSSVQYGTINVSGDGTEPSTISSVTTANSSVFWLGASETLSTFHFDCNTTVVELTSSTNVQGNILQACISGTTIVGYVVVNWNASALNQSTQPFKKLWTASSNSTTETIPSSVNVNNSMIAFAGGGSPDGNTNAREMPRYFLTNGTTVTISIDEATSNDQQANGTVIEFVSGVLTQSAQRGTNTIAAGTNTQPTSSPSLSASDATTTIVNMTGWTTSETLTTTHATIMPRITQTDDDTLTADTNTNVASGDNVAVAFEALNFEESAGGGGGDTSNASSMFLVF
jgi:hypothetical protein